MPLYISNGKLLVKDNKLATSPDCCCGDFCCVLFCECMCCSQIKWNLTYSGAEPQDLYGSVASDCHAYIVVDSCIVRATVICNGYNPNIFEGLGKPQGCDTDCHVVKIEYCNQPIGNLAECVWTTEPTGCGANISSLTAEISCPNDGAQPPTIHNFARNKALIKANAQQCQSRNGIPCPTYLGVPQCDEPCGFPCPPGPTEWRIVDDNGVVWFAGDVELNPQATPGVSPQRCSDPDDCDPQFKPKWILKDYPFSTTGPSSFCQDGPRLLGPRAAAMYIGQSATLRLEVLGCGTPISEWTTVKGPQATIRPNPCGSDIPWLNPWEQEFNWLALSQGCNSYYSPPLSFWTVAPGNCECLKDPTTGNPVVYDATGGASYPPVMKCRHCNNRMGGECGSGLEYLGHGIGVKYTNRNGDGDGSNLWNWEDAQGRYPAGWLPTEEYFGGPAKTDTDITIEGDMDTWRTARLPTLNPPQFGNVLVKPSSAGVFGSGGPYVSLGLRAETITVDNAKLQGVSASCTPNAPPTFAIGSLLLIKNSGRVNNSIVYPLRGYGLQCVVESGGQLGGGLPTTVTCDTATFKSSYGGFAGGTLNGNAVFEGNSYMSSFVSVDPTVLNGSATFKDYSILYGGTINGNAEFYNGSSIGLIAPFGNQGDGTINGNATLYDNATMGKGTVTGTATFNSASLMAGGTVNGNVAFNDTSKMTGGTASNDATFDDQTRLEGGTVTGTATFNDAACRSGGTAGTFVPNQPPACQQ